MSTVKDQVSSTWNQIKEKTGINPIILIVSTIGVIAFLCFNSQLEKEITILTGVLYPIYMSMKALDSADENDDKQWCTYWVVFFSFELVEVYLDVFGFGLLHKIIPYYFLIKLVFLIWLFFPTTQGANFIYEKVLVHFFSKYEVKIDSAMDDVKSKFSGSSKRQ